VVEDSSLHGCSTLLLVKCFVPILKDGTLLLVKCFVPNLKDGTFILKQWFPECAWQIPRDPWIQFCNGCFGVYLLFKLKE